MFRQWTIGLVAALIALAPIPAQAATPVRVRGDVIALDGHVLTVKSRDGSTVTVQLAEKFAVRSVVKRTLADIGVNSYVGSAAVSMSDGRLKAIEVLIFPEAARGTGEGHRPWDLLPESTMTNATVAETVSGKDGAELTLKYKDGEKKLVVPPDAPIVTFEPGDPSLLVAGAHVVVFAQKQDDGAITAATVVVGKDGLVPPM